MAFAARRVLVALTALTASALVCWVGLARVPWLRLGWVGWRGEPADAQEQPAEKGATRQVRTAQRARGSADGGG